MRTAKERLSHFIDFKGITKNKFSKKIPLSNSFFNNQSAIGIYKLEKINK